MVEGLPCIWEALGSIPSTTGKNKNLQTKQVRPGGPHLSSQLGDTEVRGSEVQG